MDIATGGGSWESGNAGGTPPVRGRYHQVDGRRVDRVREAARAVIERKTDEYDRRHRRRFWLSIAASLLIHILIVLAFRTNLPIPDSPFAAAGPRAGDDRAAPGGGMEVVALQIVREELPPEPEQVVEPLPVPEPVPQVQPVVEPKPVVAAVVRRIAEAATPGEGRGADVGDGIENGTGGGDGGTEEEGRFRVVPPSPRAMILPPADRPDEVRGREVDVWVFVAQTGHVVADSTRITQSSGDRDLDERLKKQAAEWMFNPARRGGRTVAEWFHYAIIL